jgi:uncharacterized OB-fold protein
MTNPLMPGPDEVPLPRLEADNRPFWTGGAKGELLIVRCSQCGHYSHPPVPLCRSCGSVNLTPTPVSGRGTVFSFTINRQAFMPAIPPPYVIAIVELEEQEGLQFMTRIVNCDPEVVRIGMEVRVRFEENHEVWVPLFEPDGQHRV